MRALASLLQSHSSNAAAVVIFAGPILTPKRRTAKLSASDAECAENATRSRSLYVEKLSVDDDRSKDSQPSCFNCRIATTFKYLEALGEHLITNLAIVGVVPFLEIPDLTDTSCVNQQQAL